MTMPHLMNCEHSTDGWCIPCVKRLHNRTAWELAVIDELCEAAEKVAGRAVLRGEKPTKETLNKDRLRTACIAARKMMNSILED